MALWVGIHSEYESMIHHHISTFFCFTLLCFLSLSLCVPCSHSQLFSSSSSSSSSSSFLMSSVPLPLSLSLLEQYVSSPSVDDRASLLSSNLPVKAESFYHMQMINLQTAAINNNNSKSLLLSSNYQQLLDEYSNKYYHSISYKQIRMRDNLLRLSMTEKKQQQTEILSEIQRETQQDRTESVTYTSVQTSSESATQSNTGVGLLSSLSQESVSLSTLVSNAFSSQGQGVYAFTSSPLSLDLLSEYLYTNGSSSSTGSRSGTGTGTGTSASLTDKIKKFVSGNKSPGVRNMDEQLLQFVSGLRTTSVRYVVELIARELVYRNDTQGFGRCSVHSQLSYSQLKSLAALYPAVVKQRTYVHQLLLHMMPEGGMDAVTNVSERADWFDKLWNEAESLPDFHNSVKAVVMCNCLSFYQQKLQRFDKQRFNTFLALQLPLSPPMKHPQIQQQSTFNINVNELPFFPLTQSYSSLITDYIQHWFQSDQHKTETDGGYDAMLDPHWLRQQLATMKLQYQHDLSTQQVELYQNYLEQDALTGLRDQVILQFSSDNSPSEMFTEEQPISVSLTLKNVGNQVLVKLYQLNTKSYYRLQGKEIAVDELNLDGVIAHEEIVVSLPPRSPYHVFSHPLSFPALSNQCGVYVLEVTAAGQKVRALLRKGALFFVSQPSPLGTIVQVLNAEKQPVRNSTVYLGGEEYSAGADGLVLLPYSESLQQHRPMVLSALSVNKHEYSSLVFFDHFPSQYSLSVSVHVNRESLLSGCSSELLIKPSLVLNGHVMDISLLKKAKIRIEAVYPQDVKSTQVIEHVTFHPHQEYVQPFTVRSQLCSLTVTVSGSVVVPPNPSLALSCSHTEQIAEERESGTETRLEDFYLRYGVDGYFIYLLGRTGEPVTQRTVEIEMQHRYFNEPIKTTLITDQYGGVLMGQLPDIDSITVRTRTHSRKEEHQRVFRIEARQQLRLPTQVQAKEGEDITLPYPSAAGVPVDSSASLSLPVSARVALVVASLRNAKQLSLSLSANDHVAVEAGYLRVRGLPAGRYQLIMKEIGSEGTTVHLTITSDAATSLLNNLVLDGHKVIELAHRHAGPSVAAVKADADHVYITIAHATASTRLHVSSSHFVLTHSLFSSVSPLPVHHPVNVAVSLPGNVYLLQARLGDEQQYVLDRKRAAARVGNMLPRPSLLLNELERRATSFDPDPKLAENQAYRPAPMPPQQQAANSASSFSSFGAATTAAFGAAPSAPSPMPGSRAPGGVGGGAQMHATRGGLFLSSQYILPSPSLNPPLDFLSLPSTRLFNFRVSAPDTGGITQVKLPRNRFSPHHSLLSITLIDEQDTLGHVIYPVATSKQASNDTANVTDSALHLHPHYQDVRFFPHTETDSDKKETARRYFTEQLLVTPLLPNATLTIEDWKTSSMAVYESLDDLWTLLRVLADNKTSSTMDVFSWLTRWNGLTVDEQQDRYSEYSCHELNMFLYHKDVKFFYRVVVPFLEAKQAKTFIDLYLLNADLTDWLVPTAFVTLNVFEQLLLAQRSDQQTCQSIVRSVQHRATAVGPMSNAQRQRLFQTALNIKTLGAETETETEAMGNEPEEAGGEAEMESFDGSPPEPRLDEKGARRESAAMANSAPAMRKMAVRAMAAPQMHTMFGNAVSLDRAPPRQLYRPPPTTKEYQERNYWGITLDDPTPKADRVRPSAFWAEYAAFIAQQTKEGGFLPKQATLATRNIQEVLLALSVVDLPFPSVAASSSTVLNHHGSQLVIQAAADHPVIVHHKEKQPATLSPHPSVTISVYYINVADPYRESVSGLDDEGGQGEKEDKYVVDFFPSQIYTCRVVLFNSLSVRQKIDVLYSIPAGSIAVAYAHIAGKQSETIPITIDSLSSHVLEYSFYFPCTGEYSHNPVQCSMSNVIIGIADSQQLRVVPQSSIPVDVTSWSHVASAGTDEQVLAYLSSSNTNLHQLDLQLIAPRWRQTGAFYQRLIRLFRVRLFHCPSLYADSWRHLDMDTVKLWLLSLPSLLSSVGPYFVSRFLSVDAESEWSDVYHHLEYRPMINARAHSLRVQGDGNVGQGHRSLFIQNREFRQQYTDFLTYLAYRYPNSTQIAGAHRAAWTYYYLLQDRVEEAMQCFKQISQPVDDSSSHPFAQLHYDYIRAYLDLYSSQPSIALSIAKKYQTYPVTKKRLLFAQLEEQLAESGERLDRVAIGVKGQQDLETIIDPLSVGVNPGDQHTEEMRSLAKTEPSLDFTVEGKEIHLSYSNLLSVDLHIYCLDLELLFSSQPFLNTDVLFKESNHSPQQSKSSSSPSVSFLYLMPNFQLQLPLSPGKSSAVFPVPAAYHQMNILLTINAAGLSVSKPLYSHGLSVHIQESSGQLKVTTSTDSLGRGLSSVYIKVYARLKDGEVSFYKDGYTDLRGRFDYASLSTDKLKRVERFALLVVSEEYGALVKEANPPGKSRHEK